ncbi:MAG TPA: hypothetical protein VNK25_02235 [Candidatus Nitrosotenuis sp.]|nr:hypothetical protein [Candidatus Nitrosotenuis sp.]
MKTFLFAALAVFMLVFSPLHAIESQTYQLGTINDLIIDGTNLYYFETDKKIESTTWIPDTRVRIDDGNQSWSLSEKLFIYPTELNQDQENLYFAALSDVCIGQILCDYQDLYKISKNDGSITILAKDLKSSVHLSVEDDSLYVSESSGNIWEIGKNGSKKLLVDANEIIMDLTSNRGKIYWIEEVADQNSNILTLDGVSPKVLVKDLKIPYDLTVQKGTLYWNEIEIRQKGNMFSEFTAIKAHDTKTSTLMEFQNTSPVSTSLGEANYGPYFVFDEYVFLVNNTNSDSVIHMVNLQNSTKYDIDTVSGYDAKYLRTDGTNLVVIGKNEDGFVIERHTLPIKVPEFPVLLMVLPGAFAALIILQRFLRN